MTLSWPFWLILVIPAVVAFWMRPLPSRRADASAPVTVLLLLLAICGLNIKLPSRSGCVVVVADRSLSMPAGSQSQQVEATELLYRSMGADDELAVVSFGQRTSVEQPPQRLCFAGFVNDVGNEASNLAEAVDRAVSLIPSGSPGRILVLSDGYATGSDVAAAAARAASADIAIDYRAMQRAGAGDLAIERIDSPQSVAAAEAFMISAWVDSPGLKRFRTNWFAEIRCWPPASAPCQPAAAAWCFATRPATRGLGRIPCACAPSQRIRSIRSSRTIPPVS